MIKLKVEKNVPFPKRQNKELVDAILSLKDGDCTYLSFSQFSKTTISNCISSARLRIAAKGLVLKTVGDENGRRVWVFKQ